MINYVTIMALPIMLVTPFFVTTNELSCVKLYPKVKECKNHTTKKLQGKKLPLDLANETAISQQDELMSNEQLTDNEWAYCQLYTNFQEYKNNPSKKLPADKKILLQQANLIIRGLEKKTSVKNITWRIAQKGIKSCACVIASAFPFTPIARESFFADQPLLGYVLGAALMVGGASGLYFQGLQGYRASYFEVKDRNHYLQIKKENEEVRDWLNEL